MIRNILVQSLAVFAAVAMFAGSAQAGFFSLTPTGSTNVSVGGTVTFDAAWTQEGGDLNVGAVDLHILTSDVGVVEMTTATTSGAFQLNAVNLGGPVTGIPDELIFGGSDLFGPGQAGVVGFGDVTVTGVAAGSADLLMGVFGQPGGFSRWLDTGGTVYTPTNATILATVTVGAVPEPTALVLLGLGVAGVAFLRRRSA
jgi:hypothetical protein